MVAIIRKAMLCFQLPFPSQVINNIRKITRPNVPRNGKILKGKAGDK
jgi:hypothetical protein